MAAIKRRKLNGLIESKNISAFGARKQLQAPHDPRGSSPDVALERYETPLKPKEGKPFSGASISSSSDATREFEKEFCLELDTGTEVREANVQNNFESSEEDDEINNVTNKKSHLPGYVQPSDQLWTTVDLSEGNAERLEDGSFVIRMAPGEKLVVLGEYGISVIRGRISILGAILSSSQTIYDVCASLSHSLPVIRFSSSDTDKVEISIHQRISGLRSLMRLSPLFAGLWSYPSSHLEASNSVKKHELWRLKRSSFQILHSRDEDFPAGCHSTVCPPEWNELLSNSASERSRNAKASITMICGPKMSGKSTFSRLLINRLLTGSTTQRTNSTIAFLDLDPGQPEFSPPGQLSLLLLSKPNFGPPYSHPNSLENGVRLIRAHSIVAVSPLSDPTLYLNCATDLFSCYLTVLLSTQVSLIINTPGWILGTGLELLINLIKKVKPTRVIYMSQDGPREVVESLQDAAKSIPVLTLPSQPTEHLTRTAAHLRTMQYISYFHLDSMRTWDHNWNSDPITSMTPLEVKYTGKAAGILGIICLGEQPPPKMVRDTIDGSVVAIVVIEDMAAVLGPKCDRENWRNDHGQSGNVAAGSMDDDDGEVVKPQLDERFGGLERQLILQTPERIPYFNPANAISLDPCCSHTIGLAIVRGIDVRRQRLQLLTPISVTSIRDIKASRKAIILVSGKLDTPGWAYLETLYKKNADVKEANSQQGLGEEAHSGGDEKADELADDLIDYRAGFEDAPWIEMLQGYKGRDAGARVWRVRRDLGRAGDDNKFT